jgi:uncharacterized protein with HEPN domain
MWRDDAYLLDILVAARQVREFTTGVSWEQFQASKMLQYAVLHSIQIMGEAASRVSPKFRAQHPEVPWDGMAGMRHRIVHDYFHIITGKVWEIVEKDVPAPIPLIEPLVPPDDTRQSGAT